MVLHSHRLAFFFLVINNYIFIQKVALARRQQRQICGFRVKLSPAHLSATCGGGFTLSLLFAELQRKNVRIQFVLWASIIPDEEANPNLSISVADALST